MVFIRIKVLLISDAICLFSMVSGGFFFTFIALLRFSSSNTTLLGMRSVTRGCSDAVLCLCGVMRPNR